MYSHVILVSFIVEHLRPSLVGGALEIHLD